MYQHYLNESHVFLYSYKSFDRKIEKRETRFFKKTNLQVSLLKPYAGARFTIIWSSYSVKSYYLNYLESAQNTLILTSHNNNCHNTIFINCHQKARGQEES